MAIHYSSKERKIQIFIYTQVDLKYLKTYDIKGYFATRSHLIEIFLTS